MAYLTANSDELQTARILTVGDIVSLDVSARVTAVREEGDTLYYELEPNILAAETDGPKLRDAVSRAVAEVRVVNRTQPSPG